MRRFNSCTVAISLLLAGLYLLYVELFVEPIATAEVVAVAVFIACMGAVWLFSDLLVPVFRNNRGE